MGTTVWSRYCLVGSPFKAFGIFVGTSCPSEKQNNFERYNFDVFDNIFYFAHWMNYSFFHFVFSTQTNFVKSFFWVTKYHIYQFGLEKHVLIVRKIIFPLKIKNEYFEWKILSVL